uniref:Polycystin cation channel PKD1/PKD2 domain-containing protein n=1 Tax=Globisporangium ultimum (strain ATCC 200006 / CBS 805.95 / DAOM BR144) TaxID=431595 RepID=K3W605_GLOUD
MWNQDAHEKLRLREPLLVADERDPHAEAKSHARPTRRAAKPMAAVEQLMLSPYEKWLAHGRFPYKIVLHVLLLVLTCAQMGIYGAQNASYMRATHRNWAYFFLPPAAEIGVVPRYQRELFTVNETLEALAFMRDAYYSIGNKSVANYEYILTPSGQITPMQMRVTRRLPHGTLNTTTYDVVEDPHAAIGPFDPSMSLWQQKHLLRSLYVIKFSFPLNDLQYGDYYEECFQWHVHVSFTMIENAQLKAEIDECHVARCTSRSFWSAFKQRFVWLHIVIALVALVYMALSVKALVRSYRILVQPLIKGCMYLLGSQERESFFKSTFKMKEVMGRRTQRFNQLQSDTFGTWTKIPFALKLKLFNGLQLVVFTSLVLLLLSSLWSLFFLKAYVPIHFWHRLLHATALLLLWSGLVGYLEHNSHIYSIVLTLKWGAPRVLQFLIGVSPIYIGYALFGTIYFGARIKEFGTLSASMATLFAVMNGDVILDTFDAFDVHHFSVSGKLYLYSFISLFIYVVLNIFIAIVEEAFFATRSCRRTLSILLTDPAFETAKVAQETEISAEMVRVLLRFVDSDDETK